ncbi:NAD(P)H-dependent oxidoreductase [Microbacterium rhizophilus]|uniref:NAD(P)H-dependent oxidoreductase n=1 Tax=Microbacterium rhizophilus TaxID=3138934 RepID=UPI0031EE0E32
MSTVFRLDASVRVEGSVTRAVADTLQHAIVAELGDDATVIRREVGLEPLASDLWATAAFATFVGEDDRSDEQKAAVSVVRELADELEAADAAIFTAPFYNWGVSQHFKTWADLVLTDPRFGPGSGGGKGKPAFLVIARGGGYGEGTPRFGWDHATDWYKRVIQDVWGFDLEVIEAELTLAEGNPAMADLVDLAKQNLAEAHATAQAHGKTVAGRLVAA